MVLLIITPTGQLLSPIFAHPRSLSLFSLFFFYFFYYNATTSPTNYYNLYRRSCS